MTFEEIMLFLEAHGSEQYRKIFTNHGIPDPKYGVKVSELKKIQKKVKKDYTLSKRLYDTGIYDAMYLAGLIADETQMTIEDLTHWVNNSVCDSIGSTAVAWVAAESTHGLELAREWIQSEIELVASAGWATYTSIIGITSNEQLDIPEIQRLMEVIANVIHDERESVKYQMNGFVIAAGGYIPALADQAKRLGNAIGKVSVDMGNNACKVPLITPYIEKMEVRDVKKRKTARC